jgi:CRISPR system Cascade subunit CasE
MEVTMYLSKILINGPACRNPYEIHRVLWKLFLEDADANRDFLFRVGHSDRNHAEVLMQSKKKPERSSVEVKILAWKEFPLTLHAGQRLRFFLTANPIKTINDESGRTKADGETKKCRVPLIREEDQRVWIERKFQNAASFETLIIDPVFPLRFRKGKEDRAGKIQPVSFQGILNVKTPEEMTELVQNGIGPAKAFGCGLLSLARA